MPDVKKIVIVMAYYNRQKQLNRTLETIAKTSYDNVEIVIVDDASPVPVQLPEKYRFRIHRKVIPRHVKTWKCPVVPFNLGIQRAIDIGAKIIVLQNPENFHVCDCLQMVADKLTEQNYLAFSCFSISEEATGCTDIVSSFPGLEEHYPHAVRAGGEMGWYNHPDVRPCGLHFFSAITVKNMLKLNGFDERFAPGIAYDDNDFFWRVRKLGLSAEIPVGAFVVHQWHYAGASPYDNIKAVHANRDLHEKLKAADRTYRAKHTYTSDLAKGEFMGELHEWIYLNTQNAMYVVEFGAGFFDKLRLVHPNVLRRIGIEIHPPYLEGADLSGGLEAVAGDMRKFEIHVPKAAMDTAMFIDTLEHLTAEDAASLIAKVQRHFRRILLFVPEGNHPQTSDVYNLGGDEFQTHRSTWTVEEVRKLGFQKVVVDPNYHDDPNKDRGAIFAVWEKTS